MPLSLLFVLVQQDELPLDRFAQLMKGPAVHVDYTSSGVKGAFTLVPGKSFRYTLKGGGFDYVQVQANGEMIEVNAPEMEYDLHEVDGLRKVPSRIAPAHQLFPDWLFAQDLRNMIPRGSKFQVKGTKKIGGRTGRVYGFRSGTEGAFDAVEAVVDTKGVPLEIRVWGISMAGNYDTKWTVQDLRALPKPPISTFRLKIPDGYTPYSLGSTYGMIGVSENLPTTGWKSNSGEPLDLKKAVPQGGLIAILGSESDPSSQSLASLLRLKKAGVKVVILSDVRSKFADGFDGGTAIARLGLQATPTFFKVDAKQKVLASWMGFDPKNAAQFEQEVRGN